MSNTTSDNVGTVAKRYKELERRREPFLDRARDAAKLTIPSLLPPDGHTPTSSLPTPYQSLGARGVNNLASKLLLTLFPPNAPFFKFSVDPSLLEELSRQNEDVRAETEKALGKMERMVMSKFESEAIRAVVFQALRQLIMAGNVLFYLPLDGKGTRMFRLDHFVVRRDSSGNPLEVIVWERISPKHLPEDAQAILGEPDTQDKDPDPEAEVDLYTYISFEDGKWKVFQELKGHIVPGSEGTYLEGQSPWLALTFTRVHGEDYGRGYVEEYMGDLIEVEGLSKSISEASAAMAKMVILVRPGGVTDLQDVVEARNLDAIEGREDDIGTINFGNKSYDLRVTFEQKQELTKSLSYAFLMHSAVQRNAERVTAEEIRFMAQELEDALGGVYSVQSVEFQMPLVKLLKARMERNKELPKLPKDISLDIAITTGIEALGRGHDLNKLDLFISGALQVGQEQAAQAINWNDYMTRRATAIGLDTEGLIKSQEQLQQEAQQAQMMQMAQSMGPQAVNQLGGIAKEGMKGEKQ